MKKLRKRLFLSLCVIVLSFFSFTFLMIESLSAESDFAGGNGSKNDPYLISNKYQLNNVRNHLDSYFKLTNDIVFLESDFESKGDFYNSGKYWIPIGTYLSQFIGHMDGNGYKITNLKINISMDNPNDDRYSGLFGFNSGTISNLTIFAVITSSPEANTIEAYSGVICGYNTGTINNCGANGSTSLSFSFSPGYSHTPNLYVGGVCGFNSGIVSQSYNNTAIKCKQHNGILYVGGISGMLRQYSTEQVSRIQECYNTGEIDVCASSSIYLGGIGGYNSNSSVSMCYNTADLKSGIDGSYNYAGGIVGYNESSVYKCYSICSSIISTNVYGICYNNYNKGTSKSCYFLNTDTTPNGCTANAMLCPLTYSGFDFDNQWIFGDSDYPFPVLKNVKNHAVRQVTLLENKTDFSGGTGLNNNPFLVSTLKDLINVSKYPTNYFKLTCDIIINDIEYESTGQLPNGWIPFDFFGVFEGNNHSISNLCWKTPKNNYHYSGVFSTNNGIVKDLIADSFRFTYTNNGGDFGGFITTINNGQIINCHTRNCTVILSLNICFGCIVGNNTGLIKDCTSRNSISWTEIGGNVGGITSNNTGTIQGCTNYSTITNIEPYHPTTGGIAAVNEGQIIQSRNFANHSTQSTKSNNACKTGGIVGEMKGGKIIECFNTGNISSISSNTSSYAYAGGLIGNISGGSVTDCFNLGDVYGETTYSTNYTYVGGLIGNCNTQGAIKNCYSVGSVSGKGGSSYVYVGYICGADSSNSIQNCYYLGVSNSGSGNGSLTNAYGMKSSDLKKQSTFDKYDFSTIWTMDGNVDYPFPELTSVTLEYKKTLKSISIDSLPSKTKYVQNSESLDLTGGRIKVNYKFDEFITVDLNLATLSGFSNSTLGTQKITVSYLGLTTSFSIEIIKRIIVDVEITTMPIKTKYIEGESFNSTGLVVSAIFNDNTKTSVTGYSISGYSSTPGEKTINISYYSFSVTFTVIVSPKDLLSISIVSLPHKTTYSEGTALNLEGLSVIAHYNNGSYEYIYSYSCNEFESKAGIQTVTINYYGKEASFKVSVLSTNSYLSSLIINNASISPQFNKEINTYYVTIINDIDYLDVYAIPEFSKSSVEIINPKIKEIGETTVLVKVFPESGQPRVYTIQVQKESVQSEKTITTANPTTTQQTIVTKEIPHTTTEITTTISPIASSISEFPIETASPYETVVTQHIENSSNNTTDNTYYPDTNPEETSSPENVDSKDITSFVDNNATPKTPESSEKEELDNNNTFANFNHTIVIVIALASCVIGLSVGLLIPVIIKTHNR